MGLVQTISTPVVLTIETPADRRGVDDRAPSGAEEQRAQRNRDQLALFEASRRSGRGNCRGMGDS